jgi:hypothetical protein
MKIPLLVIPILLAGCASIQSGSQSLPNGISEIVFGEAFWDGGSVILEFSDLDGIKWQLFLNLSLEEKEKNRNTVTVTILPGEFQEPVIRTDGYKLKKGSDDEMMLINEIKKAFKEGRMSGEYTHDVVEGFLERKVPNNKGNKTR